MHLVSIVSIMIEKKAATTKTENNGLAVECKLCQQPAGDLGILVLELCFLTTMIRATSYLLL